MLDPIIKSYLNEFCEGFGITSVKESENFENFVNYCILSNFVSVQFDILDVNVGGNDNYGIDGLCILVDGMVVDSLDEAKDLFKTKRYLEVEFIFIQSKRSQSFDHGSFLKFISAVKNFVNYSASLATNEKLKEKKEIFDFMYENVTNIDHLPECRLFYVHTGLDDHGIDEDIKNDESSAINKDILFNNVHINIIGGQELREKYQGTKNRVEKDVKLEKYTELPDAKGVRESFIGALGGDQFISLITDDDGNIMRRLFVDNVRDFLGDNLVNKDISESIKKKSDRSLFAILNNGVTIVTKDLKRVSQRFLLKDFQIVNGCQTSHIIHRFKSEIDKSLFVPVKIIVTDDQNVTNKIIKATNWQTEVKREAFAAILAFNKNLEEYYDAMNKIQDASLFYERRSKQYVGTEVKNYQIVTMPTQINAFISMFLDSPHSTHRYYGNILDQSGVSVFHESHKCSPYYVSAYTLRKIDDAIRSGSIERSFRPLRYHYVLALRLLRMGSEKPNIGSKKIDSYSEKILKFVQNKELMGGVLRLLTKKMEEALRIEKLEAREASRRKSFTQKLIEKVEECHEEVNSQTK